MPHLYTVPAGEPIADHAARLMLSQCGHEGLAHAVALVPTRRSCVTLRDALSRALAGRSALLPRIVPLAALDTALLPLLGPAALPAIQAIPPAMPEAERRYLLAQQIRLFEKARIGAVSLDYALKLADHLIQLQDSCTRAGVTLTREQLRPLIQHDVADHWKQALHFLAILTDHWPTLEQECGMITATAREIRALEVLSEHWRDQPPEHPVYLIGSTASQSTTATLMQVIADSPQGHVILPGMPPEVENREAITAGHPLFHLVQFLGRWPEGREVISLAPSRPNIWLEAMAPISTLPEWCTTPARGYEGIRLIATAHPEEEVRVIAVMVREALENPSMRTAIITPDEGVMARLAEHLLRDGIHADRLTQGTLAETEEGGIWLALFHAIVTGGTPLSLLELLRHPLLAIDPAFLLKIERGWRGLNSVGPGKMPIYDADAKSHPDYVVVQSLVHSTNRLTKLLTDVNNWLSTGLELFSSLQKKTGQGHEQMAEALASIAGANNLGVLSAEDFYCLLADQLRAPWRALEATVEPRVTMLTPVEARLETFDRVILASMTDDVWPGIASVNPWLNHAMQQALGLPPPEEHISLVAHDILIHGSGAELFLTYPSRKEGSPTTRTRFIERLLTRLAAGGVPEQAVMAPHYIRWATAREAAEHYRPEPPVYPRPEATQRPTRLPVTDIDRLFSDPFAIYARHVLGLRKLRDIDAPPEASDLGTLTHKALQALTQHWNEAARAATEEELAAMATRALRALAERPSIDLFWRARLLHGLRFVNRLEAERRTGILNTHSEKEIEGTLAGVTLHGRIDRLEQQADGVHIVDYKTGNSPSARDILEGRTLQLLTYALLTDHVHAIEYWQLPRLGDTGTITPLTLAEHAEKITEIKEKIEDALQQMRAPETPFLTSTEDKPFGDDYDGISRYDEWAG